MTAQSPTELEAFYQYLGDKLENGASKMTVEESVQAFCEFQRELEQLREEVRPALERSLHGESTPFDAEEIKARVTQELAEEGITD